MKSTRTQLHVTDICESDDTLHAAALTAERTTPMLLPEAKIDDDDNIDDDLGGQWEDNLEGQRHNDNPIDNDLGDIG